MIRPTRVLLATEGTYPYHRGGVSTWCEALTRRLPDVDFHLLAVTMHPFLTPKYQLARNVVDLIMVPLWGTQDPAEYGRHASFREYLERRRAITDEDVRERIQPHYETLVREIVLPTAPARSLGLMLLRMHLELRHSDYHAAMSHMTLWDAFDRTVRDGWHAAQPNGPAPSIGDVCDAWRLLYRLLLPLAIEPPRVDLAHSSAAGFCSLPCIMAKLRWGTPFLLTEHGVYLREQYLNLDHSVASPFSRWFLSHLVSTVVDLSYAFADQLSPVCEYNTRWERWRGADPARIRVIPNGADPDKFTRATRPPNPRPTVVSLGEIVPLKGQLDLIDAAARVRQDVPDVVFRLYGTPRDRAYARLCEQRIREHDLSRHVTLAGYTDAPWAALQQADVVAFASRSEAFPFALVEAMLCESAIVATDVGGVREALADTGMLVRPGDPDALATAILSVLTSAEKRGQFGWRARDRARRLFTEQAFTDEYRATYERLAAAASTPRVTQNAASA